MKKNDHIRSHPPDHGQVEALIEKYRVSYAMVMWKLQEMCGLTYKEARAYLLYHRETAERFAEDLGITVASVHKLKKRATWKVESSGFSLEQIAGKYDTILYRFVELHDTTFSEDDFQHEEEYTDPC
jgi:hypothetical protein